MAAQKKPRSGTSSAKAKRATPPNKAKVKAATKAATGNAADTASRIVQAALELASASNWNDVTLKAIAKQAKIALADLLEQFGDKNAIISAFMLQTDRQVIERLDPDLAEEEARERLLDIYISRLEVLSEHKAAVLSMWTAVARDPQALLALNAAMLRSQKAMMAAADLDSSGVSGALRAQGLALMFARALRVWLHDDDPGMARAMAKLDSGLRDGEAMLSRLGRLDDVGKLATAFVGAIMKRRQERRNERAGKAT